MAVIPLRKIRRRLIVRYYICTDRGLRRMPLKLYRDLLAGETALPQFANKTKSIIETLLWRPSGRAAQIRARITSDHFDDRGILDLADAAETISIVLEGSKPKRLGHNLIDIGPVIRSRKLAHSTQRVPRFLMQQIREDVEGTNRLPNFRVDEPF